MPSLDVVSAVDLQLMDNAVNNSKREIASRYDFRGMKTEINFDRKEKLIQIISGDEWKVKTVKDILVGQCVRQRVDPKSLDFGKIDAVSVTVARMEIQIKEGIPKEVGQKIAKYIKNLKIKVQPTILDDKLRVTGKQIDDLQEIMRLLREQDYGIPLQFVNLKN